MEKTTHTAKICGQRIVYDRYGDGERFLLILHGWGCDRGLFSRTAAQLAARYTVLVPDLCGFGDSEEPHRPFSVGDYAEICTKFIESLGIRSLSLLGHSYGGRIIFKLFENGLPPFTVEKIFLIDAAGIRQKRTAKQKLSLAFYKVGKRILLLPPVRKLFPHTLESWRAKRGSADYNAASEVMKKTLSLSVNEDLSHCMKNINCPTLLFWGEADDATPLSDAKSMEKSIRDAGLVVVPGGSHFSFLDAPALFARVLSSFFELS